MPLDFRYHIISITAVFMALILGISIGVAIKRSEYLDNQISELKSGFQVLDEYKELDKKNNQLITELTANLTKDTLINKNVMIIYGTAIADNDITKKMRNAILNAGATITSEIYIQPNIVELDSNSIKMIKIEDDTHATEIIMTRLGESLGTYFAYSVVDELKKKKGLTYSGDATQNVGTVIYFGAITKEVNHINQVAMPLLKSLSQKNLVLAAVSPTTSELYPNRLYSKHADITVDNIDTPAGILALLTAIKTQEFGNYGIARDTNYFVPNIGKKE